MCAGWCILIGPFALIIQNFEIISYHQKLRPIYSNLHSVFSTFDCLIHFCGMFVLISFKSIKTSCLNRRGERECINKQEKLKPVREITWDSKNKLNYAINQHKCVPWRRFCQSAGDGKNHNQCTDKHMRA